MLNSNQLSEQVGISERHVRRISKCAAENSDNYIECNGEVFKFQQVDGIGGRGKVYAYTPITTPNIIATKPRRRVPSGTMLNPADLPEIAHFSKPTAQEKLAVITFCNTSKLPYGHIAKCLISKYEAFDLNPDSLKTKMRRWEKAFKKSGISALEDKRGGREATVNVERIKRTLYAVGTKHYLTQFEHYCYLYAQDMGIAVNVKKPSADIHYTTYVRAVERLKRDDANVLGFSQIGMDSFTYAEPSIGREWEYPNEQWEIDATPQDIMVKVPMASMDSKNKGYRDYFTRVASGEYQLVRMQIIGIIDNCTGATVYGLYNSSNYYANTRLVYKAMAKLGKPELLKGDNGADFVSKDFTKLIDDLGITYLATAKGRGDEKGKIERSFRTLQHSPAFENLAGFIGHNVNQRQHLEMESSTKLEKLSGVATNIKGDPMWWWEFENWLDNYLNHTQTDRYAEHTPESAQTLENTYRLLGKRAYRKVSKSGVRHNGEYYLSKDFWEHVVIGQTVEIIENIDDSTRLNVFINNCFVCEIVALNVFRKGTSIEEIKQIKKAYKQRVVKQEKALVKQAQRDYKGFQNAVRDAYLDDQIKTHKVIQNDQIKAQANGFDPLKEKMRLLSGGRV